MADAFDLSRSQLFGWNNPAKGARQVASPFEGSLVHDDGATYTSAPGALAFENELAAISDAYHISPNPADYFFRPVPAIISDIPNRNGIGFPLKSLTKWNAQQGRLAYMTWKGKPMYEEHGKYHQDPENPDITKAIGVIVDVSLRPLRGFGGNRLWKVMMLAALDRTAKDKTHTKDLVGMVERQEVNTYSMGALVSAYTCSICNSAIGRCTHVDEEDATFFQVQNGVIAHRLCWDIEGCELSVVLDPAVGLAASDYVRLKY